jgi:hypothetical protein
VYILDSFGTLGEGEICKYRHMRRMRVLKRVGKKRMHGMKISEDA